MEVLNIISVYCRSSFFESTATGEVVCRILGRLKRQVPLLTRLLLLWLGTMGVVLFVLLLPGRESAGKSILLISLFRVPYRRLVS